ncbi:MAG TPA: hypothetical protein EYQ31_11705 [Candidatus Handelsmanbacteria bacterium]|nr:hypothetical protein [Candidatus Handelsmanbacteria bacterium]
MDAEGFYRWRRLRISAGRDYIPEPLQTGRSVDGSEVHGFCHLAKQHNGYVALGLNEVFQGRPDLIFWQNNRGNLAKDEQVPIRARQIGSPMVASNRVGFSYHHFQAVVIPSLLPTTGLPWSRRTRTARKS